MGRIYVRHHIYFFGFVNSIFTYPQFSTFIFKILLPLQTLS
ncbi:hypothetical protein HMPREF0623_1296 [Pediococcus acidilactici DSM 20284]|uniref:Uncharacterized protein n=1 Tax=Pediococcus acidilactici DSM 20284 TaxID=862514 RepID=E0NG73_PEDAC|nr:hypothetical protein HMPREF0623_1296 [Pediococcus acidilactici DSM 20284]